MKYIVSIAVVTAFLLPNTSLASNHEAGLEFLSPLVQNIITLLHDRIAELDAENQILRAQLEVAKNQCIIVGGTVTQTNEEKLREEYMVLINKVEADIQVSQEKLNELKAEKKALGTGITASEIAYYNEELPKAESELFDLEQRRASLWTELSNKLRGI